MAWFRNHYVCTNCEGHWVAEQAAAHTDECPYCSAHDTAPYKSDDRTAIVEPNGVLYAASASR